jgi:hypothetical protein
MDRTDLLKALKADDLFAVNLKDVLLSRCTVAIITAVAGEEPTVDEEKAGVPLELGDTVGMLAQVCQPGAPLFIRVSLPQAQTQGMYFVADVLVCRG